jgi:two-component system, LuxR family, response regulator FixJ
VPDPHFEHTVYVIDDDREVRTMISRMLGSFDGFRAHPFVSAADFLEQAGTLKPGCILLDLRMPDIDGFAVLERLRTMDLVWPAIVLTGAGDVSGAVQAMKLGAVEFLEKPVRLDTLETSLTAAARLLDERLADSERRRQARNKVEQLSAREQEVLQGLMAGQSNKELARSLGIGLRTVEMHRGHMMERLGASSVAQAVAMAIDAGLRPPE